jgi:hypothetical protein
MNPMGRKQPLQEAVGDQVRASLWKKAFPASVAPEETIRGRVGTLPRALLPIGEKKEN